MPLLDDIGKATGDGLDKIGEVVGGAIDAAGDAVNGIKEAADSVLHPIDTLLGNWGTDLLEGSLSLANKATFSIPNVQFVNTVTNIFIFVTTTFAICIVLYKVIEAQIQASNGSGEPLVGNVVQRLLYSSMALCVLPWAMNFFIKKIVAPLGEFIITEVMKDVNSETVGVHIRNFLISLARGGKIGAIILFIFLAFFAFSIGKYFISICVFYADFLVLTMLTPLVALSLLTDEQNYFQIWVKELLSQSLTMIIKLTLYTILVTLLVADKYSVQNFMIMIGCGLLLIKTPSALENMWYSTKVGRGGGGLGNLAMLSLFKK